VKRARHEASRPSDFEVVDPDPNIAANDDTVITDNNDAVRNRSVQGSASERTRARLERDRARGYSINAKQVALAFAVEFVIIGLILTNQSAIAAELPNADWLSIVKGTSLPIALAMAELARVPLAIAVRTQPSWNIKLVGVMGVISAVVVTAVNLSVIGWNTYDPRLAEANETNNALQNTKAEKDILSNELDFSNRDIDHNIKKRDSINERLKTLQSQISAISTTRGETCSTTTGADGSTTRHCTPTNIENKAILKTLQGQLSSVTKEFDDADVAVRQSEAKRTEYDSHVRGVDEKIAKAEAEYRAAVNRSQLHSYAAMLFGKNPRDLSDGEIKTLERYLIWIPAIAAALSSTLIAMTAVRRIERPTPEMVTIPDEAAEYLFGPLVKALREEAKDAVAAAMSGRANPT
jgi:hypothetical protein